MKISEKDQELINNSIDGIIENINNLMNGGLTEQMEVNLRRRILLLIELGFTYGTCDAITDNIAMNLEVIKKWNKNG